MSSACVCHIENEICWYCEYKVAENALREIDNHIRSAKEPVPYIIETLKQTLPEYKNGGMKMENVKVYQLNEYDAVAAESLEEAKVFYMNETGMDEEEAFYDYDAHEITLDTKIWNDEEMKEKTSLSELIKNDWKGKPFFAFSTAI